MHISRHKSKSIPVQSAPKYIKYIQFYPAKTIGITLNLNWGIHKTFNNPHDPNQLQGRENQCPKKRLRKEITKKIENWARVGVELNDRHHI